MASNASQGASEHSFDVLSAGQTALTDDDFEVTSEGYPSGATEHGLSITPTVASSGATEHGALLTRTMAAHHPGNQGRDAAPVHLQPTALASQVLQSTDPIEWVAAEEADFRS